MSAHLISIGVRREYRRRRFGTALIEKLIGNLNPSVKELRLEVRQDNAEAITLYKGLGFKYVETVENYYEDGSNAVKMLLNIEGRLISSRNRAK
jgi:ribosomal protein S18 acetylase RimI-like enzyme